MSSAAGSEGSTPSRTQLIVSTRDWSSLSDVARAVSVATEHETKVYVERLDDRYRWSLIHRGGPYPLLRITARFLQVDHRSVYVGFKQIQDGYSALCADPEQQSAPSASAILAVAGPTSEDEAEHRIRQALE